MSRRSTAREARAAEPILPLALFSNPVFVICCAVGFIVGLAMFGSVTYMPVYLQVVKGVSPTMAGFVLTPMMAGVLITSIASGQIISRIARYRPFPIAGTAVMTLGLGLLATLGVATSVGAVVGYMLVLGLGLGMVMQVLVLAVQNAVEYRNLGVATSGTTLFRSIGGSVGVSLFGTIFTAMLIANLAGHLPVGVTLSTSPEAIGTLPPAAKAIYLGFFQRCTPLDLSLRCRGWRSRLRAELVSKGTTFARVGADNGHGDGTSRTGLYRTASIKHPGAKAQ